MQRYTHQSAMIGALFCFFPSHVGHVEETLWMASAEEGFFFFLISRPLRLLMWDSSAHVLFYGVYKKDGMVGWG